LLGIVQKWGFAHVYNSAHAPHALQESLIMNAPTLPVVDRAERFRPLDGDRTRVLLNGREARLANISVSGLGCYSSVDPTELLEPAAVTTVQLALNDVLVDCGTARVVRASTPQGAAASRLWFVGVAFTTEQGELLQRLLSLPFAWIGEGALPETANGADCTRQTLDHYHDCPGPDILEKCRRFQGWVGEMHRLQLYQRFYRVTLNGPIDSRVTARGLMDGTERALLCFDSNSYLGLHLHPKVLETVETVTRAVGYGTPSAQLLCGTNRYLRELEDELCEFHEREAAMVFPTGFAANVGILRALVRSEDAVFRDQHAHASIHEGCRMSGAKRSKIFAHNDMAYLERLLTRAQHAGAGGRLVVTDGVFSMHGGLAPLPELVRVCREHGARLMVDDAHGVGVLGETGRGVEEHFDEVGSVDILMGTLSKAGRRSGGLRLRRPRLDRLSTLVRPLGTLHHVAACGDVRWCQDRARGDSNRARTPRAALAQHRAFRTAAGRRRSHRVRRAKPDRDRVHRRARVIVEGEP
jgi:hypothetical protein